jgi:hypothetical protein
MIDYTRVRVQQQVAKVQKGDPMIAAWDDPEAASRSRSMSSLRLDGSPVELRLTGGRAPERQEAEVLLDSTTERLTPPGDRGYDSNAIGETAAGCPALTTACVMCF